MAYATDHNMAVRVEEDYTFESNNSQTQIYDNYELSVDGNSKTLIEGDCTICGNNISLEATNGFQVKSMTNNQKATASMALDSNGDMNVKGAIVKVN